MTKIYYSLIAICFAVSIKAQSVSTFEDLNLSAGTYWYNSSSNVDTSFTSGSTKFLHKYNGYWESGWVYSNIKDSITSGYTNLAASRPAIGNSGSANYAVGQHNSKVILEGNAKGGTVQGVYVTNGTYAAISMETGDAFAKKFGGASGNDPDYFLLTIKGYRGGVVISDSVNFYLADFRFSDSAQDYLVKDWQWVNLSSLGAVDSLVFQLSSSDVGQYGMNTPGFFCIDDFTVELPTSITSTAKNSALKVYPNPSAGQINLELESKMFASGAFAHVYTLSGTLVGSFPIFERYSSTDLSYLTPGIYILKIQSQDEIFTKELVIR